MFNFEDLNLFFTDFAVPMVWQGRTIQCHFSQKHDPLAFNAGGRDISATVKTADMAGVVQGQAVVIDGRNFSIEEIKPIQDGQITRLQLEEV